MSLFGKKQPPERDRKTDAVAMSRNLREKALSVTAQDLNIEAIEARPNVWAALMELGYPEATATLVAFADGTTSLYISTGGGIIGAGEHPPVREEADRFLSIVQQHIAEFAAATSTPLPRRGHVRFYVRTFQATLTAEVNEELLERREHTLSPVYVAGHAVLTQIRLASQKHQGR